MADDLQPSNVKKIRVLNLPGTPWATSACCGMTFTLQILKTLNLLDIIAKFRFVAMFVFVDLLVRCVFIVKIHQNTKFHVPSCSGSAAI